MKVIILAVLNKYMYKVIKISYLGDDKNYDDDHITSEADGISIIAGNKLANPIVSQYLFYRALLLCAKYYHYLIHPI